MSKTHLKLLGAAAVGLMAANPANATLIAYEGFDYAEGSLAGLNGGTGWGSSWTAGTVVSGSLSYGSLATSGNSALISGAGGSISAYRDLAAQYGMGTYYVSFIGQRLQTHGTLDENTIRASSFQLHNGTGTSGDERLSAGKATTASPDQTYTWDVFSDGSGALGDSSSTQIIDLAFVVMEINIVDDIDNNLSDSARMWINPSLTDPLGTPDAELTSTDSNNFDYTFQRVRIFSGGTNGQGPYADFAIDEIRIATTLAEVGVVPEPSSLALLGIGGLGLMRRRRRSA